MPGLFSSPVCLTVIWLLSWSLRPSRAQIQTDEVSGVQYGLLQSNVTLACGKSQNGIPVAWHLNHSSALPWHKVTSNGSLVLMHVDHSAQGNYSCYDNQGLLLHSVRLMLGYPPGKLNISCRVPNHTHIRCSWVENVKTFLPASYNASLRGTQESKKCAVDVARKYCDIDHFQYWQFSHTLRITETNGLGSQTSEQRFKMEDLLKPDPPESVLAEALEGFSQRLMVSWKLPSSWPLHDAFPLIFQIKYKPQGSVYWSEIYSLDSPITINDALEGHLHEIQVRARDELDSDTQWSEWSPVLLVRPWQAPTTPEPTDFTFIPFTKPEVSTEKSHNPPPVDEGNLGLVILLVLFSMVILTTVLSLIFVMWLRQRRRDHATLQELASMVKMKSMPI